MGATLTTLAAVVAPGFAAYGIADVLLAALILAAGLESIFAYCLGCQIFGVLVRAGIVPDRVCVECADVRGRIRDRL